MAGEFLKILLVTISAFYVLTDSVIELHTDVELKTKIPNSLLQLL